MAEDGSNESLMEWTDALERALKETCDERFEFTGEVKKDGMFTIHYAKTTVRYLGNKDIPCMVKVVKKNLPLMPPKTRAFFADLISVYDR